MKKDDKVLQLKINVRFILAYRLGAFLFITLGLLSSLRVFTDNPHLYALFTYTIQSNILVWVFFLISIFKTVKKMHSGKTDEDFGFYPSFSFAVCIAITITFLIFWLYLAPTGWTQNRLLSFSNLSIHFFCPLLVVADRILFYKKGVLKKRQILYILIFPYIYVAQSFILGLTKAVWFSPVGVESYYIYPFLDLDAQGAMVFVYLLVLTVVFFGLSYLWYSLENRGKKSGQLQ